MSSLHIQKRSTVLLQVCLGLWLFLGITGQAAAEESFTTTISFYAGFDLTSGMTELDPTVLTLIIGDGQEIEAIAAPQIDPLFEFSPEIDLYFGFSANADRPFTVVAEQIKGMIVLEDTDFEAVTENMLKTLDMPAVIEVSIDQDDLVVLLTQDDQYVLLGSVQQMPGVQVQFTYQTMSGGSGGEPGEVPEPSTLLLLGVGLTGVLGCLKRTQHYHTLTGGKTMKQFTMFVLLLLFGMCSAGAALAAEAELQILVIGNGFVRGEEIGCSYSCTKSFEKGTVVHLKAIPFPNARFVEWKVDGQSHAGVITIEGDTVVSAIFERKTEDPMLADGITLYWYGAYGGKNYAKIALDEMFISFQDRETWNVTTEEEYQAIIKTIAHTFHPQAEIVGQTPYQMFLKSPERLERDQWFHTVFTLLKNPYIRWAGPVLYRDPWNVRSQVVVWDGISVYFPSSYTEEQITAIEQVYGLVRLKVSSTIPNKVTYQAVHPLEAIELANRLYESGLVELACPDISESLGATSEIPDDEFFPMQWHLSNPVFPAGDINVLSVWQQVKGFGKVIAIVDDGVEFAHEDLSLNKLPDHPEDNQSYHADFLEGDHDPIDNGGNLMPGVTLKKELSPECPSGCHGTAVAGLAGGRGFNATGISGAAPFANLIGFRIGLGGYAVNPGIYEGLFSGGKDMKIIDVYNNSWAPTSMRAPGDSALLKEMENGSKNLNISYIWSAGNIEPSSLPDDQGNVIETFSLANSNYNGYANSRYSIAVGASGHTGRTESYSSPGANVLINAPVGGYTTDRSDNMGYVSGTLRVNYEIINYLGTVCQIPPDFYLAAVSPFIDQEFENIHDFLQAIEEKAVETGIAPETIAQYTSLILECARNNLEYFPDGNYTDFSGTSAAAPLVSGVVALMLEAREQAGKPELTWRDVQHILIESAYKNPDQDWASNTNAAGYSHTYKCGFGRVDAAAAVEKALDWTLLPDEVETIEYLQFGQGPIPENEDSQANEGLVSPNNHVFKNIQIEFAELEFTATDHPRWGDVEITLRAPTGTESRVAEALPSEKTPYQAWRFGTRRHVGEPSQGDWQLTVKDLIHNADHCTDPDCSYAWVLKFYGTALPTWTLETPVASTCQKAYSGVVCTLSDGSGSVTLTPTGVANPDRQYVFPDRYFCEGDFQTYCAPRTTHSGTYWFPTPADDERAYGINLNITMDVNPAWLPLPADQQTTQTISAPVCSAMSPSEPLDVQKALRWTLSAAAQEYACPLSLTWEDVEKPGQPLTASLTLTFQDPTGACQPQLFAPASGTVDVLARYPWEEQDATYLASIWKHRRVVTPALIFSETPPSAFLASVSVTTR